MKRKRLLLLLALLMTAATGAWAQDAAKHLITATYDKQTRLLEQPLPYETTVGALYEAVTGKSISDFISFLSAAYELNLTGITSGDPSVVSIGEFNDASTKVKVTADGKATVILHFGNFAQGIFVSVVPPLYVTMADGTKDAAKWTATVGTNSNAQALPVGELSKGNAVTLTYGGRLKVKNVTATHDGWDGDLTNIPASLIQGDGTVIVPDGTTLTGTLNGETQPYKITIAADATVTLDGVTINGVNNTSYKWAGLNCLGNATIVLKDGTTNTVRGFFMIYPGIHVPEGSTLTITGGKEGTGKLTASPFDGGTDNSFGAGIGGGGGYPTSCGDIDIQGGVITATGGVFSAGIGGGCNQPCGNISIEGGTVTATGGPGAAGIGGGLNASCGNITIASTVTRVTATNGGADSHSIGAGNRGTCGTVTIGGTVYWQDNAAVGDGATYLGQATIVYPDPLATPLTIEAVTPGTIQVYIDGTLSTGMKYSVNGGTPTLITTTTEIPVAKDDKVQFYGNGTDTQVYGNNPEVNISGGTAEVKVYGNIMSLLDETGFATKTDLPNASFVFYELFAGNTTLNDASELLLPATTLANQCYVLMFAGCTSLTKAPKLPATTLATDCYWGMFKACTSLTSAYVKAAYTGEHDECGDMFDGCTADGAVLHTTSDNKVSWEDKMGMDWSNWSVADDWQD